MPSLPASSSNAFRWVKPQSSQLHFELRDGDALVATLTFAGGAKASGIWDDAQYQFSRKGWFRQVVYVRSGITEPVATFARCSGRETLVFPDGRAFVWKQPKRGTKEYIWADSAGTELLRFIPSAKPPQVAVTFQSGVATLPAAPLLILLGQYLIVRAAQDEEMAQIGGIVATMGGASS